MLNDAGKEFRYREYREDPLSTKEIRDVLRKLKHPTLLQRPIGLKGDKAVVGRPPEELLQL